MSAATRRASKAKKRGAVPPIVETIQPTDIHSWKPTPMTKADLVFGAAGRRMGDLLPPRDALPEPFRDQVGPWCRFVSRWFFEGVEAGALIPKPGIDKTAAIAHCAAIMRSWEPKHEHKIGGVAFLLSIWFEPLDEKSAVTTKDGG